MGGFTPRSSYHRGKTPQYQTSKWLGGPQTQYEHFGEEKNCLLLLGNEARFIRCPACSLITLLTALHLHCVVLNYVQGQNVHCHVHNTRSWVLSRDINPVHVLEPHFHSIHCNVILTDLLFMSLYIHLILIPYNKWHLRRSTTQTRLTAKLVLKTGN